MDLRVLSIQSHVVHGYVGNKSVVFPLQLLGYDVDFINSVQFSNHTWYKVFKGQVLDANNLNDLYHGLTSNGVDKYSHILTGYMGAKSFLEAVVDVVKDQKRKNKDIIYVCDPVMGDNGSLYVPADLLAVYQEQVLPLVDILVPNQFEAELLTGMKIHTEADALQVLDALHAKGISTVVLSSSDLGCKDELVGYFSTCKSDDSSSTPTRIRMRIPKLQGYYVGTGDLFAALLLAWSQHHPDNSMLVCRKVQCTMQAILCGTRAYAQSHPDIQMPELRLIQHRHAIENPPVDNAQVIVEFI